MTFNGFVVNTLNKLPCNSPADKYCWSSIAFGLSFRWTVHMFLFRLLYFKWCKFEHYSFKWIGQVSKSYNWDYFTKGKIKKSKPQSALIHPSKFSLKSIDSSHWKFRKFLWNRKKIPREKLYKNRNAISKSFCLHCDIFPAYAFVNKSTRCGRSFRKMFFMCQVVLFLFFFFDRKQQNFLRC